MQQCIELTGTNRTIGLTTLFHSSLMSAVSIGTEFVPDVRKRVAFSKFLTLSQFTSFSRLPAPPAVEGIPGNYRHLAIPVLIPNTVVKQVLPMILRKRESRYCRGLSRPPLRFILGGGLFLSRRLRLVLEIRTVREPRSRPELVWFPEGGCSSFAWQCAGVGERWRESRNSRGLRLLLDGLEPR